MAILGTKFALFYAISFLKELFLFSNDFGIIGNSLGGSKGW